MLSGENCSTVGQNTQICIKHTLSQRKWNFPSESCMRVRSLWCWHDCHWRMKSNEIEKWLPQWYDKQEVILRRELWERGSEWDCGRSSNHGNPPSCNQASLRRVFLLAGGPENSVKNTNHIVSKLQKQIYINMFVILVNFENIYRPVKQRVLSRPWPKMVLH